MAASRVRSISLMTALSFAVVTFWVVGLSAAEPVVSEARVNAPAKPWHLSVGVSNIVGSGTFITDPYIRQSSDFIGQSWSVAAGYDFEAFGRALTLGSSWSFDYEFTTPNGAMGRRFSPHNIRLAVSEAETYREPLTDVVLSTALRLTLPASYESRGATDLYFSMGVGGALERSFGPMALMWSVGLTKYVQGSKIQRSYGIVRCDGLVGRTPVDAESFSPQSCAAVQGLQPEGFPNTSALVSNRVSVVWNVTESVNASYSLGLNQYFKYGMPIDDVFTGTNARGGMRRLDYFWPTFDVSLGLNELVDSLLVLPFELSLSAGISATHPTRSADDRSIIWPFFTQSFGSSRAAHGYGSVYVDLSGTW